MKTLKELRNDSRVYEIILQDTKECEHKYAVNLNDGYTFDGYSGLEFCDTVAEINELMKEVR